EMFIRDMSNNTRKVYAFLNRGDTDNITVAYVYLNLLQESQEFVTSLRKMLRASGKLNLAPSSYRSFSTHERTTGPHPTPTDYPVPG
ncbi:MAG: hypothetical protein K2I52_03190, partial [Muribaculaceae bacterium]|nr:hypothetical protein [Muribaculaceae bacterium]